MPYQFKLTLLHSEPLIWRRVVVPEYLSFEEFHFVIQIAMGWDNNHMYVFRHGLNRSQEIMFPGAEPFDNDEEYIFADEVTLPEVFKKAGKKIEYEYDFGDSWIHEIHFEKRVAEDLEKPVCLEGEGACPQEDVGGIHGYYRVLDVLKDPKHKEYKDFRMWLGLKKNQQFDPKKFSAKEVNEKLAEVFRDDDEE